MFFWYFPSLNLGGVKMIRIRCASVCTQSFGGETVSSSPESVTVNNPARHATPGRAGSVWGCKGGWAVESYPRPVSWKATLSDEGGGVVRVGYVSEDLMWRFAGLVWLGWVFGLTCFVMVLFSLSSRSKFKIASHSLRCLNPALKLPVANVQKLLLWRQQKTMFSRWWFQIFVIFTPTWGRFRYWLIFFKWVETTN